MGDWAEYLSRPGGTRIYRAAPGPGGRWEIPCVRAREGVLFAGVNPSKKPRRLFDRFDWWHCLVTVGCLLFTGSLALRLWLWVLNYQVFEGSVLEGVSWISIAFDVSLPSIYLLWELWRQVRLLGLTR